MFARFRPRKNFQRHAVTGIDANFVASLQRRFRQFRRTLQNHRLQSVLAPDAQTIGPHDLGDFCDGPRRFVAEIADDHVSFIDQNARAFFQLRDRDARIDVAIIIRTAHDDMRGVARWTSEKCPDAVRGRSHLLDDFLQLLDHLARFGDRFFVTNNFRAQRE